MKEFHEAIGAEGMSKNTYMITVFNEAEAPVGTTFPRRAKQLVRSGRAVWREEGRAVQLLPAQTKEEAMSNGEAPSIEYAELIEAAEATETAEPTKDGDALLMYLAKQNVQERRSLVLHTLAFFAAWPGLLIFWAAFVDWRRTPVLWHYIIGAMLAWGGWIAYRVLKRTTRRLRARARKMGRPDPVTREYQRLKDMASG